jgi:hypothetical protein
MADGDFFLVEPCCGGAALSLYFMGAKNQLVPYQGSKWKLRRKLAGILEERGLTRMVSCELSDIGPWGDVWKLLLEGHGWVIEALKRLDDEDPRVVYERLHGHKTPHDWDPEFAAEFLFLQRLAHSGKAVGIREGKWNSPGFNKTSAYGTPGTDNFGEVKPMIPALIRELESGWELPEIKPGASSKPAGMVSAHFRMMHAANGPFQGVPLVFFLDPPYRDATRYPGGHMPRSEVVRFARSMHGIGAMVIISEAEPIDALVELDGWEARCLKNPPGHNSPFRAKGAEWVTISPAPKETR